MRHPARFYSVSYMATPRDPGACATFYTRAEAERCRQELIDDSCYWVSSVWF